MLPMKLGTAHYRRHFAHSHPARKRPLFSLPACALVAERHPLASLV